MVELADTPVSKTGAREGVGVQISPWGRYVKRQPAVRMTAATSFPPRTPAAEARTFPGDSVAEDWFSSASR